MTGEVLEGLRPLAEEAVKYDTFDEFEKAFLTQIKHGRYYHITDNPNFTIDPEKGPQDLSSMAMGEVDPGKLMITSNPEEWIEFYGEAREYVAIIDMSRVPKEKYLQVKRGFGNEFFVDDPSRAKVIKVVPVAEAIRDANFYQEALEETITGPPALEKFYNEVKGIAPKPPAVSVIEYDRRYTLEELRDMAKAKGLSASGSKKELAAKLIAKGVR